MNNFAFLTGDVSLVRQTLEPYIKKKKISFFLCLSKIYLKKFFITLNCWL